MQNVCRTCLNIINRGDRFFDVDEPENHSKAESVKKMLMTCIPELALDIVDNMVICTYCWLELKSAYKFKIKCVDTEKRFRDYLKLFTTNVDFSLLSDEKVKAVSLARHTSEVIVDKLFVCPHCQKNFISQTFLNNHAKTHKPKHICQICAEQFPDEAQLQIHVMTHCPSPPNKLAHVEVSTADSDITSVFIVHANDEPESKEMEVENFHEQPNCSFFDENDIDFEITGVEPLKKVWTHKENLKFITIFKLHRDELENSGRKKEVWQNIAKELTLLGVRATWEQSLNKWKSLTKTYKLLKSTPFLTRPKKFRYYDEMEKIFNDTPEEAEAEIAMIKENLVKMVEDGANQSQQTDDQDKSPAWTSETTSIFLEQYEAHMDEMLNAQNAQEVWTSIAAQLSLLGVELTPEQCEGKWNALLQIYFLLKNSQSDPHLTSKFQFFDKISEILAVTESVKDQAAAGNVQLSQPNMDPSDMRSSVRFWEQRETLELIRLYEHYLNAGGDIMRPKDFWDAIARDLKKLNIKASSMQCNSKWKTLKRSYLAIKSREKLQRGGRLIHRFFFYQKMQAILEGTVVKGQNMESFAEEQDAERNFSIDDDSDMEGPADKKFKMQTDELCCLDD